MFLLTLTLSSLFLYLFADASPEWRGLNMYAATTDIFCDDYHRRLLMPVIALGLGNGDTVGKVAALLWQLWLLFGPRFDIMRQLLSRVRSITSDMGTEKDCRSS